MNAIAKNFREAWKQALRFVSREHLLALVDQGVVSGTSFLTTLSIARWSGSSQLGIYAVGMTLLFTLLAFQDSLISQPYAIQRHYPEGSAAERAGASLTLSILFSTASILVLTVTALGFLTWGLSHELVTVTWAIAGIVPFALTRDFARRFAFARLEMGHALILDLAVAIVQLSALGWLGVSGRMSAVSAWAAIGGASALAVVGWLYCTRAELMIRLQQVRAAIKRTWALGKWLLVGRISVQVSGYVTYWLLMAIAGAAVTGVYAACMSIVAFVNPLLLGLGNSVMPRSVMAWKNGGGPALRHEAIRNAMLIAALMASFSLAIAIGGETVMRFLYHGKEFEGQGLTLTVLALATFSGALGMPASNALATIERPRAIVAIGLVGTVFTAVLVWVLMEEWGLFGAACGLLAGSVVGDITRWVAFFMLVPRAYDPRSVMGALGDLTEVSDVSRWTVKRLGEGVHAEAFVVNSTGEAAIWRAYHSLVTKLYKPEAGLTLAKVQAQFDSLSDLHTVLDGRKINGWKISVPRPLCILKSPLALVMSSVPGRHIDSYKSKDDLPISKNMLDAARAFTAAMEGYWSSGRRHGDLALQNILFDIEAKEISIIDAGTGESCQTCNVAIKQLATASDLAHLLWSVAIDVWDLIRSPSLYMDREIFVESVLLATLGRIDSQEGRRQLLNEILSCAQQHLADKFELAWSFRGLWNGFVRRVATQRMDSIVDRVTSHLDICASEGRQYKFRTQRAIQALTS